MDLSGRVGLTEVTVVGRFDLCGGGVVEFAVEPLELLHDPVSGGAWRHAASSHSRTEYKNFEFIEVSPRPNSSRGLCRDSAFTGQRVLEQSC